LELFVITIAKLLEPTHLLMLNEIQEYVAAVSLT